MRQVLVLGMGLVLWVAVGIATLWLLLVTAGSWSHVVVGASDAYEQYDVRAYSIWEGVLFKAVPDRVSVKFPAAIDDAGRFRYRPATGRLYEWPEDGGPDGPELGELGVDVIAERLAVAMPDRDEASRRLLAGDVVRLVEVASGREMFDLAWEDWDVVALEDGSLPPADGWNILRPRFGGTAPVTARRSLDWTMLLIAVPGMVAFGGTVGWRRLRTRQRMV